MNVRTFLSHAGTWPVPGVRYPPQVSSLWKLSFACEGPLLVTLSFVVCGQIVKGVGETSVASRSAHRPACVRLESQSILSPSNSAGEMELCVCVSVSASPTPTPASVEPRSG